MTAVIIITLSVLVLLAYVFDVSASKTKIPSVMLLLTLGLSVKLLTENLYLKIPDLSSVLPILGTIGLILIVLEGSLELEINKSKSKLILNSVLISLIPMLLLSFGFGYYLYHYHDVPMKIALTNAIPLAIISSAIAIPSAANLPKEQKDFITYESSLSDIFGVIFFNFISLNANFDGNTFGTFSLEMIMILVISFVATLLLAGFLNEIKHHVKFVPMIIIVVLIYAISKVFHLPALIFIMIFGLFIGNIDELRRYKFIQRFHPINFSKDVHKFREITTELAFLTRALFFILFGFLIDLGDLLNQDTIIHAVAITASIFVLRFIVLALFRIPVMPLGFLGPRGLITILLFLSIPVSQQTDFVGKSLIIQIIILTALVMMFGLMIYKKPKTDIIKKKIVKPTTTKIEE